MPTAPWQQRKRPSRPTRAAISAEWCFLRFRPGHTDCPYRNGTDWSTQVIYVNRADPRWISEERAYPGLRLKLIGRNLDAAEYNGDRNTQVRFVP